MRSSGCHQSDMISNCAAVVLKAQDLKAENCAFFLRTDSMDYYKSSAEKADTEMEPLLESSDPSTQYEEGATQRGRCHRFRHGKTSKRRRALRFIMAGILTYIFTRFIVCDLSNMVRVLKDRHGRDGGEKVFSQFTDSTLSNLLAGHNCIHFSNTRRHGIRLIPPRRNYDHKLCSMG